MKNYLVCTTKLWNFNAYEEYSRHCDGNWRLIKSKEELTQNFVQSFNPRYIFFPHWSWKVPNEIIENFECVCFHSSDVPYGRGGSPIQNLIIRGHQETCISALKMTQKFDAGPVYLKVPLSLKGRAQDIFESSAQIISKMIKNIVENEPLPVAQVGESVVFQRRKMCENELPAHGNLEHLYNHIRMLDADEYPKSFLLHGSFLLEFYNARYEGDELIAEVRIKEKK